MSETLYLIDGHAQIFRAYYAIRGGMHSPVTGEPTHAVFGFAGMLLKLLSQFHPHYVVVAVDVSGPTFRDDLFDQYKGTRGAAPEDLISQVPRILELVNLFGLPIIGHAGLEADDVIATIAQRIVDDPSCRDINVRIVSKDKDLEQMLSDRVTMFDIHTDTLIDTAWLKDNKGITPAQVVDLLSLTGDTVDNVPGVEGIGPKTAAQLIQQFGSVEGVFENIEQIKGKRRENLEKARAHLPLSKQLVTLKRDADFPFSLEAARVRPLQLGKILQFFQQLGFNRYQDEVRRLVEAGAGNGPASITVADSAVTAAVLPAASVEAAVVLSHFMPGDDGAAASADYRAITTREQLDELVATLRQQSIICVDTETTGLERDSRLCGLSFSWQPGSGVYVPTRSPQPDTHLDEATVLAALQPLLEDESLAKCGHNLKFDCCVLLRSGVRLRGIVFDTLLASILTDPTTSAHKLDFLAQSVLHYEMIPISGLIGDGGANQSIAEAPLQQVVPYAAEDADIALRLYRHMLPQVQAMGMERLLRDVEAPLEAVLAEMEANGIICDPDELQRQGRVLQGRVDELVREIHEAAGCQFDLNSTRQLAEMLFDTLGLKAGKKTKTGRSTDIQELERLAALEGEDDPKTSVPRLIIEYRQLTKLISTYLGNLRAAVKREDGRIHSTFHQLVTATGRLASHNPNLQNIPVRSDVGRQIRKAFHAPAGHLLICADYSQIELRLLAHFSGDEALTRAFAEGQDIHTAVASQVFNTPLADVTREQRNRAKTINFGIIYGVTAFGLARRIKGLDVPGATALIADYRRRFPGLDRFLQQCVQHALEHGYVATILGRRRAIPEITSSNRSTRSLGERLAINTVVQGSAADLIKIAMVNVQRRIEREHLPMRMLLQIHDELVLEAPAEIAQHHADLICEEMERALELRVPLKAECGVGFDWLSAK